MCIYIYICCIMMCFNIGCVVICYGYDYCFGARLRGEEVPLVVNLL